MGLFEVIKYPIQDWQNYEEFSALPLEIVRPWAEQCLGFIEGDARLISSLDHSGIVERLTISLLMHCRDVHGEHDVKKMSIYCYYFTRMLKKSIENA